MNPFEFVIVIIVLSFLYKLVSLALQNKHQSRNREDEAANGELLKRLEEVEERVRVLERIVTDERFDLKQQFKDLGA
jgi:adenine-specific DNA methylase